MRPVYNESPYAGRSDYYSGQRRTPRSTYAGFAIGTSPLRKEWTHLNSAQRLPNGQYLTSLRNFDLLVEVNPAGTLVWTYGALVLKHQHCARDLGNGNLLITNNGNARVIEIERATQRVEWEYSGDLAIAVQACAYRLPCGDTLITDQGRQRVLNVTPDDRIAWQLKVTTPGTSSLYRAFWSPPILGMVKRLGRSARDRLGPHCRRTIARKFA